MSSRNYYGQRHGYEGPLPALHIKDVAELIALSFASFDDSGYFTDMYEGTHGEPYQTTFYLKTRMRMERGVYDFIRDASEVELFTVVEFLFDNVSAPIRVVRGPTHYDRREGRREWCARVNRYLAVYGEGFELSEDGEVLRLPPTGQEPLLETTVPEVAGDTRVKKFQDAVRIFQRSRATREDRKRAIRELADILESYKQHDALKKLSKDASDLFNIANNFTLRHLNERQRDDYGEEFVDWIFYAYLNTVRLVMRLAHGDEPAEPEQTESSVGESPEYDDIPF